MQFNPGVNRPHDGINVSLYHSIIKSKKFDTAGFQLFLASLVLGAFELVAFAIDFHGK